MFQHPLRFEPFLRPMPWGGRRLARFLGKNLTANRRYGESWEVSDHAIHDSRLATATMAGITMRQLMMRHRGDLLGTAADKYTFFPWLIKLLDAQDMLSVQVHPDEAAAMQLCPGEAAKTEAWYVLDAAPESRIYAGLKPGVGPRELREALTRGTVADCLRQFAPKPGDVVFVPAGTVHALGAGILVAEIQQTSDATFRLFDWNRLDAQGQPRALHLNQAFASIHWSQGCVEPIAASDPRTRLVSCPYFEIDRFRTAGVFQLGGQGRLQAWIVTQGHGRFANGEFFLAGDAWILPAAMPTMTLHPDTPTVGLLCTLP